MLTDQVIEKKDRIIARNMVAQKQFADMAGAFIQNHIDFIPLKGIVLLDTVYPDISRRFLSDIDMLVRKKDLWAVHQVMTSLGYDPVPSSPCGWIPRDNSGIPVDIESDIWYLSRRELDDIWSRTPVIPVAGIPCRILPREEMIVFTLAHAFIHHGNEEGAWRQDLFLMLSVWKKHIDVSRLMRRFSVYAMIPLFVFAYHNIKGDICDDIAEDVYPVLRKINAEKDVRRLKNYFSFKHPLKGHFMRFVFQRNAFFRIMYVYRALLPGMYFLKRRYDVKTVSGVLAAVITRPFKFIYYSMKIMMRSMLQK